MAYERFTNSHHRLTRIESITILKGGCLALNKKCTEKYFKGFSSAALYYDPEQKKIGIQPTNEIIGTSHLIMIRNGTLRVLSTKAFLRHFGIAHKSSKAYPVTWNEKEEMAEIQLTAGKK